VLNILQLHSANYADFRAFGCKPMVQNTGSKSGGRSSLSGAVLPGT
jgi:hypothetical protein